MALVDLVMPKMGESIMEATILKWLKKPGDMIVQDETVLEIATDKVDSEVPATEDGVIEEILFKENEVVPVGAVIARIRTDVAAGGPSSQPIAAPVHQASQAAEAVQSHGGGNGYTSVAEEAKAPVLNSNKFYSPLVLNIAANEGVSLHELENIEGTGNEGRVTKNDILRYVNDKKAGVVTQAAPKPQPVVEEKTAITFKQDAPVVADNTNVVTAGPKPPATIYNVGQDADVEIIEMDRQRKLIAEHMVRSKHTSPHVTSFSEADVTNMVLWRDKVKKNFEKQEGTKITFMPLFIEAIARCIKKYPLINSSLEGDKIYVKKDINIGMATALPSGNLIVPVIKNADQLNLVGLAKQVNSLADKARTSKLKPTDTQSGTFTLTNVGSFGSLMGTPIINQPQVAILAVGAIKKRAVVIETPQGDAIAIRHMIYLSMSYDHRIVDGSLGATFLTAVANELENFDVNRSI
ncbi:dihydrolipoamide acetyltransferase family protein [Pinibacter soli]|uniref:Dihydrolipoamide acetyltransferase component of pyruvate dehydrogenase complex n=1 Tax=Pinibacter soli TaxID=3044211 RepID=A0ABT6RA39_9BACT|nr:dihydrolipoamide acetyltransferase family protein [Pinibacter soli]MDI3319418.1 dihydrolipoamide acetyltransferase family protein [Pinibacter soli]